MDAACFASRTTVCVAKTKLVVLSIKGVGGVVENEFPERLRKLREREGKSRVVLSQLCGLPESAIRRYERGEIKPNVDSIVAIADYFRVSVDYLLGRTNY